MGGCCSSRKLPLNGTPVYYCYPPTPEEHESLTSHDRIANIRSSRIFTRDLNADSLILDSFQRPPTPIPYDVVFGKPQSTVRDLKGILLNGHNVDEHSCINLEEANHKTQSGFFPSSPKKPEVEPDKSNSTKILATDQVVEEDCCPTCLEEYDKENPKITAKCNHGFHLSCILEWMERSDTCPICDQEMVYETL